MKKFLILPVFILSLTIAKSQTASDSMKVSPNPFSQRTLISYTVVNNDTIGIDVLDLTGSVMLSPRVNYIVSPGNYQDSLIMDNFPNGIYYVILKNNHKNLSTGKIVKSSPTSLLSEGNYLSVEVYPNPVRDKLHFEFGNLSYCTNLELSINNVLGQLIYVEKVEGLSEGFNVDFLSNGLYYLKLKSEAGQKVFRIVKE